MNTRQAGFSLLEGVVVVGFLGLICLMAAPMFARIINDHALANYSNDLVANLTSARRAAVQGGQAVSLCASDNGRTCTDSPWARGYLVFRDEGQPGVLDGSDRPIKVIAGSKYHVRVTLNGANFVRFHGNGGLVAGLSDVRRGSRDTSVLAALLERLSPIPAAHATDYGFRPVRAAEHVAFLVCRGNVGRTIQLNAIGRVNSTSVACN